MGNAFRGIMLETNRLFSGPRTFHGTPPRVAWLIDQPPQMIFGKVRGIPIEFKPIVVVRTALLLLLLSAMQIAWILENPASSVLLLHPTLRWALKLIQRKVSKAPWK